MSVFHKVEKVPVQSVLNISTREEAVNFPRGDIRLGFCGNCGLISNVAFKPELLQYTTGYEATQSYSPTFNKFAKSQAELLIDRYGLHGKTLLEIGCGNGEFLTLLCELGDNLGIGFDPAYVESRIDNKRGDKIEFIKDYYSEKYSEHKADFFYCKMTLEHISDVDEFISVARKSIGDNLETIVFFQVPDVTRILEDCAFEDIYYEHCSYFSPGSLSRLFRKCGFEVINVEKEYDDQYLTIEAKPSLLPTVTSSLEENDLECLNRLVTNFPQKAEEKLSQWHGRFNQFKANKTRVVLWGSGSKGVAFLTTLNVCNEINYIVDINPHRQGTFMAKTGQKIVSPNFLMGYQPDAVIVMNAIYKDEIRQDLQEMGLSPEILALD
jgi:SAM-dependent methyltransferase